jgi:hypothetical protein
LLSCDRLLWSVAAIDAPSAFELTNRMPCPFIAVFSKTSLSSRSMTIVRPAPAGPRLRTSMPRTLPRDTT